jgi:hypothetical protein
MREGPKDLPRSRGLGGIAAEAPSNGFDQVGWEVGKVSEGLVFDLITVTVGTA